MKKILLKYLNLYVLSGLLLVGFAGCSDDKDNDPVNPGPDVEELPSIGTYSFRAEHIAAYAYFGNHSSLHSFVRSIT